MNSKILLLALTVAVLSSCTTAYKTGQTPDDVYYSAAKPQSDEKIVKKEQKEQYAYSEDYYDDRYLRMKVSNRYRWNELNDWYSYDRYSTGYNYQYGSYYNPFNSWNYFYNPYCCCQNYNNNYSNPKNNIAVKPLVRPTNFNLAGYKNGNYNNSNINSGRSANSNSYGNNNYNNTNNNNSTNGVGKTIRTIFESNNNNNGSSGNNSNRTYTPSNNSSNSSSGSSSGSSSSGSSGGGVTRPVRN